ncbi:MAG: ATP-binding protein [Acidimicrobiia bacterium]
MRLDVAVCLPQEARTVALIRCVVGPALTTFGVSAPCVDDIRLALSEACTNVLEHAAVDDEYEVAINIDDRRCEIRVKNTGNGFDAAALAGVMPDPTSVRGRGVAIMRAVMDNVEFRSEPETGTVVYLVKEITLDTDGPLAQLRPGG